MEVSTPLTKMTSVELVAISSGASILTLCLGRVRCLIRPCSSEEKCISGCTDQPLRKDEHELDVTEYHIGGREVLILTGKG